MQTQRIEEPATLSRRARPYPLLCNYNNSIFKDILNGHQYHWLSRLRSRFRQMWSGENEKNKQLEICLTLVWSWWKYLMSLYGFLVGNWKHLVKTNEFIRPSKYNSWFIVKLINIFADVEEREKGAWFSYKQGTWSYTVPDLDRNRKKTLLLILL